MVDVLYIAIIALVVAAIYLIFVLVSVLKQVKQTLGVLTNDANNISGEVEKLLVKANDLTVDIQGKMQHIDPAFIAIGDLGVSVSNVNQSMTNLSKSFVLKRNQSKKSIVKMGQSVASALSQLLKK